MQAFADLPLAEPCSPARGVVVERRGLLATIAAALATTSLPGARPAWRDRVRSDGWTVAEFVREVTPVCKELVADRSARGQDRYLHTLAAFAVGLGDVPVPGDAREVGPGHRIGSNHGPDPFTVLHWQLEPHAVIEPHAHTYGNVVTLGLRGDCMVRNYEVVGARDFDATYPFDVMLVQEQVLRPGDVNLVSLERHYVHGFQAGATGASGLDITTRIFERRVAPVLVVEGLVDREQPTQRGRWRTGK